MSESICFVMPSMNGGGAERVVSLLANEFVHNGHDITLFLTNGTHVAYDLDERVHIDTSCALGNPNFFGQIKAIRTKMKEMPKTVFISFMDDQNLSTLLAGIGMPNRVIISQRNDPHRAFGKRRLICAIHPWLYTLADCVVFQTKDALEYYPKYAANKYRIILNPLSDVLPSPYEGERSKCVVTVCRLNEQKNLPLAIDAFAEFLVRFPDYTFEIYGEGALESDLKQYAVSRGVGNSVHFCGFRKDVHACISDAAMFVISSDFEGLSNSMIEAIALGIPTIATDCPIGGARMVIDNGVNGYLVPVRDKKRLVAAMCSVAGDPGIQERFSKAGARLRERLSLDSISKQWLLAIQAK
ncbi:MULTISPECIES: glycosyltransferase [unclassified Bifidobacterium]|uniref:glycosyltransferase n=1 Tax=unclassified Bifidobacterium TaxID=2608897 RepID=UPI001127DCD1|nr:MULTISPECIES: glycosyltransferase [unclassified Bifidobacterium]